MTDLSHVATQAELSSHDWYMSDEKSGRLGVTLEKLERKSDVYFCLKCTSIALCEVGKGPPDKATGIIFCNSRSCEEVVTVDLFSYF